ncbi:MAG: DNA polymerase I [Alloprevotella sp.]
MKKLYLLDAYALIYRAYYALIRSPRINSRGENTSAIFGFVNTLEDILSKHSPDLIAVAFDPAGPTFRHEAYPEYKAQRDATPEDIRASVPVIKEIIRAYNIPILEQPGYEADDVIGTMAHRAAAEGYDVYMVTPDKDYGQLVRPGVTMCRPGHGGPFELLGEREVCEKYGIASTAQVIDLLTLMGDTADNIPGCPGVGEKTAVKLIGQFGSVDNLLLHTDEVKGALRKKIEENAEKIKFSKFLVTIKTDVPLATPPADLIRREADKEALKKIFERYEMRSFLKRLFPEEAQSAPKVPLMRSLFDEMPTDGGEELKNSKFETLADWPHQYHLIENVTDARSLCERLLTSQHVAVDTETTGTDPITARLVGMSFSPVPGEAYYVAVPADEAAAREMVDCFRPLLESDTVVKVGQNLKYDINVLTRYGVEPLAPMFDTMLAHYVVQPELHHNMDYLAEIYLNYATIHIEQLIGPKGKSQKNMADLPPTDICDYACEDADVTLRLMPVLQAEMRKFGVERVFEEIEMPLMPVLARMERNGVCLDTAALAEAGEHFKSRLHDIEAEVYALAGHPFNITSPRQVGEVLFEELRIVDKARKTKTGQYSTGEEVLESLRHRHPIVEKILDYRGLKKLVGTYVDALPKLVNPATGHIHTSFNQAVTATGRLSSSNPNLQNIPVKGEDGREIRKVFVPEPDCVFFSADYSQIELRIMACLSGDAAMIKDFNDGRDIHAATAARIFKKPLEAVDRDERRKAKTANFGIIYGISAFGLSERMDVTRAEAKELIDNYFDTYPDIRTFISQSVDRARECGYIETLFGRRRYLPDINSRNAVVRGYAERNAVNAPIQGTAADIIKIAMARIDRRFIAEGIKAKMILQVHDELNFSVPRDELDRVKTLVIEEMEQAWKGAVPLVADCGVGNNWLEAH